MPDCRWLTSIAVAATVNRYGRLKAIAKDGRRFVEPSARRNKGDLIEQPRLCRFALCFKGFDFVGVLQGQADFVEAV